MRQRLMCTAILILMVTASLSCLTFKDFPLGCYSYLGNKNYVYENREYMIDAMHDLGYNTNILEIFSPGDATYSNYDDVFTKMDTNNIGFIIMDKRWDASKQYSTCPLSTSNYYKFEAMYNSDKQIVVGDLKDSSKWYTTREKNNLMRTGHRYSNQNYWECTPGEDEPGYAYTDLFYRWQSVSGDSIRIGREFIIKKPISNVIVDHFIYITYKFSITSTGTGLLPESPLVSFHPCGYKYSKKDPTNPNDTSDPHDTTEVFLTHTNMTNSTVGEQTDFTWGDYLNMGSTPNDIKVTLKIGYDELLADSLFWDGNWALWGLVNLNPECLGTVTAI